MCRCGNIDKSDAAEPRGREEAVKEINGFDRVCAGVSERVAGKGGGNSGRIAWFIASRTRCEFADVDVRASASTCRGKSGDHQRHQ